MWAEKSGLYRVLSTFSVLLMTLEPDQQGVDGDTAADVDHHLELGKKLLAAGQLTEALSHYHAAVEGDPTNYLTFFKRAAVFLALGRSKSALPDLDQVITLRPDFLKARIERANIRMKQGHLEEASDDFWFVLEKDQNNKAAADQVALIEPLMQEIEHAKVLFERGDHSGVVDLLAKAIELCPWDVKLRQMRAHSYEMIGEYFKAIQDLRPTTKLISDNMAAHLRISLLAYALGEGEDSLREIRECLKLDQDHKECHKHYKKVKKLVKFFNDAKNLMDQEKWGDALMKLRAALKLEGQNYKFVVNAKEKMCHCHAKEQNTKEAIQVCSETIEMEKQNVNALCDRADSYLLEDNLDDALKDYQSALEINKDFQRAKEGVAKINKMKKQMAKRDYYKILGVKRTAGKAEILKKYRKLAAKWHPDRYKGKDKEAAEKKFMDIAAAKEVLTDPEKRAKFDQGEDPLDPEAQNRNPFQGGFQDGDPFGGFGGFGQGFQFKFHFN